ncbi:hypothetical protein J1614_002998 [Plenodomus biglobosus]|nr:hypothetical protein J1614_002998 [Plenodomus biglobosus]
MSTNPNAMPGPDPDFTTPAWRSAPKRSAWKPGDGPVPKRMRQKTGEYLSDFAESHFEHAQATESSSAAGQAATSNSEGDSNPGGAATTDPCPTVKSLSAFDVSCLCQRMIESPKEGFVIKALDQLKDGNVSREAVFTTRILSLLRTLQHHSNHVIRTKAKEVHTRLLTIPAPDGRLPMTEIHTGRSVMHKVQDQRSDSQRPISQPNAPSLIPSPAQQSLLSLASRVLPPSSPFSFSLLPSGSNPGKAFPLSNKIHADEEAAPPSRLVEQKLPDASQDQQKPTPATDNSALILSRSKPIFKIETCDDFLTWVRTFLDIDAANMEALRADLQMLYKSVQEFTHIADRQAQADYKRAIIMREKSDEIAALEKDIARTNFNYNRKPKIIRLQNLQLEVSGLEREIQEERAMVDILRDSFTKAVLVPLRTFTNLTNQDWQKILDMKQNRISDLRSELSALRNGDSFKQARDRQYHEVLAELQNAFDEEQECGTDCRAKLEKLEQDLAASRNKGVMLTDMLSLVKAELNSALVAHKLELAKEIASKAQLEKDIAAKMGEMSLQEGTFQTKYREKMKEKITALKQDKDTALHAQKQKYEAQIEAAQEKALRYAKADSKVSDLERQIKTLERERVDLIMTKATLEKQLQDLKSRGKQLQSFEDAYEQVKRELDDLQSTYNDVEVERDELKEQVDALQDKLKTSARDKLDAPDSRHMNGKAQRREDEHTRSVAAHWENQLKSRMAAVDKKMADLATYDAEIAELQLSAQAEASASTAPPPHPVVGPVQLLDVGVLGEHVADPYVDADVKAEHCTTSPAQQAAYPLTNASATAAPVPSDQPIRAGPFVAWPSATSRKERGVRLGRPENGEAAWQEVPIRRNVK